MTRPPAKKAVKPAPSAPRRAPRPGVAVTRQKILAAALELFSERGYAAATTAEIARRARVAEKTLFAHFASKERLFDETLTPAALEMLVPSALAGVRETLTAPLREPAEFLRALMTNRVEFVKSQPAKLRLIAQAILLHPELVEFFLSTFRTQVAPLVDHVIDHYEREGALRAIPRESLMRIVVSVTMGYTVTRALLRPQSDWDDAAEVAIMVDVLLHGLRRSAASTADATRA